MKEFYLTDNNLDELILKCAFDLKKKGTFLLVPTETVYGFVCSWNDQNAINRIYKAKGRNENKPFQMLASDIDMVKSYGGIISVISEKIVKNFCPGPITIVVPTIDKKTLGFRIPEHKFTLDLIKKCNFPLAGTSANLSGEPPALIPQDALKNLFVKPEITVNSGRIHSESKPSTVVKVNDSGIEILREGPISLNEINSII